MVDLVKLEELAKAATPLDLSSAEKVRDDYEITCPVCDGEGEILAKDWCNIDDQAIGVQVYGIGEKMIAMERFIDAANPSAVLELIVALTSAKAEIERLKEALNTPFPTMLRKMWSGSEVQKWLDARAAAAMGEEPRT